MTILNVTVDVKKPALAPASNSSEFAALQSSAVGVDLGLKDLLALSNGKKVPSQQFYRDLESPLAAAQRAGHKQRVKTIHAKIANRRKDHLHKLSARLVRDHGAIFIGNVSAFQLQYKGHEAGCWVKEVNEAYSTQDCLVCQARSGPKGRVWQGWHSANGAAPPVVQSMTWTTMRPRTFWRVGLKRWRWNLPLH